MKHLFTLLSLFIAGFVAAQTVVPIIPQERNAVLEEYTGIKCGYCPDGHYRANLLAADNPGRVVLVNIHQGSFAVPSTGQPDFRTPWGDALATNANISGYPSGTVNRQVFSELNSGIELSRNQWTYAASKVFPEQSPVNVAAWSTIDLITRELTVYVELYYTKSSAQSTNYLNVALLQNNVLGWQTDYASPAYPGGNTNNYSHKHILRHFLTGQWGDAITTTTAGTFVTKSFTYTIPDDMLTIPIVLSNCDIAVYVSETHNNIYTGVQAALGDTVTGETRVYAGSLAGLSPQAQLGVTSVSNSNFEYELVNAMDAGQNFRLVMETNAPGDWAHTYSINGSDYTDTAFVTVTALDTIGITLSVTPGTSPKFAKYTLTLTSVDYPLSTPKVYEYYVLSGATDLIVNGSGAFGDGNTYDYTQKYIDGLTYAGNTSFDVIPAAVMEKASQAGILSEVNNLYLNIGWTFPSFTDEEATAIIGFLNGGGNVLCAGQDIGWDIMSGDGYGTTITKNLFTNYFHAVFSNDGASTNTPLIPTSDHIFKNVGTSAVVDAYAGNIYPDQINPSTGATTIFKYSTATGTKNAGLRYKNSTYKIVYLGLGLEMISNTTVSNNIMKRAHDWFYGLILDAQMTSIENANCNTSCDGQMIALQTEGTTPAGYLWSNSETDSIASGLCAGTYTVTIGDGADTLVLSGTITAPPALAATGHHTNASCPTCSDGIAWVTATGETGNYTFLWNDNAATTNDTASGLLPGTYLVTVTDTECGTTQTATVVVNDMINVEHGMLDQTMVYPNPAQDILHITFTQEMAEMIEICDVTGKVLMTINAQNKEFTADISSLPCGMYFIRLTDKNHTATLKFRVAR
ncbi:MAG: hypothetical protein CVU05_11615 [Bacteroidetes bacterium HGW-Bacteroidetes-21]|nr:MAG: hypothetical protein CVU05_11615 [Bacteroidetes bacterium HGW-Bacteroidetes-21]